MAKKILIPLDMNGVKVRSLESLKENFDLEKVTAYFLDGTLLRWLESRYYEEEAEKVRNLSKDDANLGKKLCEVFGVEYKGEAIDVEDTARRHEILKKLKQLTTDEEIISHAAQVAFTQEDLAYLLNADETTIYLCGKTGEKFFIPASFENRKYIGILGKPEIKISIETFEELKARGITFENVDLPKNLLSPTSPSRIQGHAVIKNVTNDYVSPERTAQPNFGNISGNSNPKSEKWQLTLMGYYYAKMLDGTITLSSRVRILTNDRKVEIYDGSIFSLIKINNNVQTLVNRIDYDETDDVKKTSDKKGVKEFFIHLDKMPVLHSGCIIEAYTAE